MANESDYPYNIWITFPDIETIFRETIVQLGEEYITFIDGQAWLLKGDAPSPDPLLDPPSPGTAIRLSITDLFGIPELEQLSQSNVYPIPVPPETIAFAEEQTVTRYSVISLGEVAIPGRKKLTGLSWESHFPLQYDVSIETIPKTQHIPPRTWVELFRAVQNAGLSVRVSIDNAPVDKEFILASFKGGIIPGPKGDIWYQISFIENREGVVREWDGLQFPSINSRGRPNGSLPDRYTVIPGDTLQDISWKLYGTVDYWEDIYKYNEKKILQIVFLVPEIGSDIPFVYPSSGSVDGLLIKRDSP